MNHKQCLVVVKKYQKTYLWLGRNCQNGKRPDKKSHVESTYIVTEVMVSEAGLYSPKNGSKQANTRKIRKN